MAFGASRLHFHLRAALLALLVFVVAPRSSGQCEACRDEAAWRMPAPGLQHSRASSELLADLSTGGLTLGLRTPERSLTRDSGEEKKKHHGEAVLRMPDALIVLGAHVFSPDSAPTLFHDSPLGRRFHGIPPPARA